MENTKFENRNRIEISISFLVWILNDRLLGFV